MCLCVWRCNVDVFSVGKSGMANEIAERYQ